MRKRWWPGVVMLMIASVPAAAAASDWYAFAEAGTMWSFRRSNHDEVEFGDEPGGSIAAGLGRRYSLDNRWRLAAEGQLIGQVIPLHGRNDKREATADGREFWLAGVTVNGWPEYALSDRCSLYAGGGLGPAIIAAFGSSTTTLLAIAGVGVRLQANDELTLDLGGRYYWTAPADLEGARSEYDSFGPSFRLTWFLR